MILTVFGFQDNWRTFLFQKPSSSMRHGGLRIRRCPSHDRALRPHIWKSGVKAGQAAPSVVFSKAMIYQSVLRSKLAQLDRQSAISELKKKLSLLPRKPRVKNAKGKFFKKKLGQYVLNRFNGFMVFFSFLAMFL